MTEQKFIEGSSFENVWYPRYASIPDGPQMQSMVRCMGRCMALKFEARRHLMSN